MIPSVKAGAGGTGQGIDEVREKLLRSDENLLSLRNNVSRPDENISRVGENISRVGENISRVGEIVSRVGESISRSGESIEHGGETWNGPIKVTCRVSFGLRQGGNLFVDSYPKFRFAPHGAKAMALLRRSAYEQEVLLNSLRFPFHYKTCYVLRMEKDINELKIEMSELAERIAGEVYGIELDYSVDSIKKVEKVLGNLHKEYKKTKDDDGFYGIAIEFGAYIVRVVEKNDPTVRWERNHPEMGEDSFPLFDGTSAVFPVSWCYKRLLDGPGDDVWTKYQIFILKNENPEPTEGDGFLEKVKNIFKK